MGHARIRYRQRRQKACTDLPSTDHLAKRALTNWAESGGSGGELLADVSAAKDCHCGLHTGEEKAVRKR